MKSKKLTNLSLAFVGIILLFLFWLYLSSRNPLSGVISKEWLEHKDSNWQVLPYGYTLGPWPKEFKNSPIVTKLTYNKGPPKKFIQSITQLWQPVEVELTLLGPKTLKEGITQSQWKDCFDARFTCNSRREKILDYIAHKKDEAILSKVSWFDQQEINGPRGIHLVWEYPKYLIDDFVIITENGIAQGFELKSVKSNIGDEARSLLYQILGSLSVKEDLTSSREWIQNKIRAVQLAQVQEIENPKERLTQLIAVSYTHLTLPTIYSV